MAAIQRVRGQGRISSAVERALRVGGREGVTGGGPTERRDSWGLMAVGYCRARRCGFICWGGVAAAESKVDSKPVHGSRVDIPHMHAKQNSGFTGKDVVALKITDYLRTIAKMVSQKMNLQQRCLIAADQASVFMEMTFVHISSGLVLFIKMTSDA
ncbi:hypothetical protein Tco_0742763 [Tanacetum coccineum]